MTTFREINLQKRVTRTEANGFSELIQNALYDPSELFHLNCEFDVTAIQTYSKPVRGWSCVGSPPLFLFLTGDGLTRNTFYAGLTEMQVNTLWPINNLAI